MTMVLVHRVVLPVPKGGQQADRWRVSIGGLEIDYSKGIGLREYRRAIGYATRPAPTPKSVYDVEAWNATMHPVAPTADEVVSALASDARTVVDEPDIDAFAREYCDGLPVSKVLETYSACTKALAWCRRMGVDIYADPESDTGE